MADFLASGQWQMHVSALNGQGETIKSIDKDL
jgi:hypothetical protein